MNQELLGLSAMVEEVGDEKHEFTTVSTDEHSSSPDVPKASPEAVYASMLTAEADNVVTDQVSPNSCRESDQFPNDYLADEPILARTPVPEESAPA